jgi:ribosome biogenesis GTPase / thiamine phosphate phosphatase
MSNHTSLTGLGWQLFFQQQCSLSREERDELLPARIIEQYRTGITVATGTEVFDIPLLPAMPDMVVGDWILLTCDKQFSRLLQRKTCFSRKASGHKLKKQLIAANVDVAFIVASMNDEFNLNRLERFLAVVHESGAEPVILLSKRDKANAPEVFIKAAQSLDLNLAVCALNCLDDVSKSHLSPWLKAGSTVAVLGSSGVGKSTLINTLLGENRQSTGDIRKDDSKGRHTTTRRSLIALGCGGLILDTPGIREIQLADCKQGIAKTFSDVERYIKQCRFNDCQHRVEPGCAVQQAIESGDLDKRRLDNYLKLCREDAGHSASLAERRTQSKARSKVYKSTQTRAEERKGRL